MRTLAYGVANNNDEDPFVVNVTKDAEVEPQFSQPTRQIILMLFVLGIVGAVFYVGYAQIAAIFLSNPYLNGLIPVSYTHLTLPTICSV